jgi:hypothetical protein
VSRLARAQAYPTRPVRIIVPVGPGGANDIVARPSAPILSLLAMQNSRSRSGILSAAAWAFRLSAFSLGIGQSPITPSEGPVTIRESIRPNLMTAPGV